MPLVRIALREGKSTSYRQAIGDAVHQALVEIANVPKSDRFQIITDHDAQGLIYDPDYLGISRSDDIVIIQITFNTGRDTAIKRALFVRIADLLHQHPGIRREDVFVGLAEVPPENWSFGKGDAQYAK